MSSLNVACFERPGFNDHPGIPVKVIAAAVIRCVHLVCGQDLVAVDAIKNPEFYLKAINISILSLHAFLLFCLGLFTYYSTKDLVIAVVAQLTPLFILPDILYSGTKLNAESVFFIVCILLGIGCVALLKRNAKMLWMTSLVMAIACALGITTKLNFIPVVLLPFVALPRIKWKCIFVVFFMLSCLVCILPVVHDWSVMWRQFSMYVLRTGVHASGTMGLMPPNVMAILKNIYASQRVFIFVVLTAIAVFLATIIMGVFRKSLLQNSALQILLGLLVVQAVQLLAVVRTPLMYYLIPATGLLGTTIAIVMWQVKQWRCVMHRFSSAVAYSIGALFVIMSGYLCLPVIQRFHAGLEKRQAQAVMFNKTVNKMTKNMATIYGQYIHLLVPALHFGNCTARSAHSKTLANLYSSSYIYTKEKNSAGKYQNWYSRLPFDGVWKLNTNLALVIESGFKLGKPDEPLTCIFQDDANSIYRISTNIDPSSIRISIQTNSVHSSAVMPLKPLLAGGVSYQSLQLWLNSWSWRVNDYDKQIAYISKLLLSAIHTSNVWRDLKNDAKLHEDVFPEAVAFLNGIENSNDVASTRNCMRSLSSSTNKWAWPLYVVAMHAAPTNIANDYVVLWPELAKRGIDAKQCSDHELIWFQFYYQKYCGWRKSLEYWEWIRQIRPTYSGAAVINQALLEFASGNMTNVVVRLSNDWDIIVVEPWIIDRADQMLQRIKTPDAQQLLQRLAADKNKRRKE
jgi:hypothetical protein